uniref:Uncharacterized protein n=1 Tax=Anopheles merus TaxID=30066 RepID=A0A182UPJ1_ANOME
MLPLRCGQVALLTKPALQLVRLRLGEEDAPLALLVAAEPVRVAAALRRRQTAIVRVVDHVDLIVAALLDVDVVRVFRVCVAAAAAAAAVQQMVMSDGLGVRIPEPIRPPPSWWSPAGPASVARPPPPALPRYDRSECTGEVLSAGLTCCANSRCFRTARFAHQTARDSPAVAYDAHDADASRDDADDAHDGAQDGGQPPCRSGLLLVSSCESVVPLRREPSPGQGPESAARESSSSSASSAS